MLKSIQFKNFKILRNAILPLERFTLIIGPNGSGKSTALQALQETANPSSLSFEEIASAGLQPDGSETVEVRVQRAEPYIDAFRQVTWTPSKSPSVVLGNPGSDDVFPSLNSELAGLRIYSFAAPSIAAPVVLQPQMELTSNGGNLAGVLDRLRDQEPERFEFLNEELGRWFLEFDRILFDTPGDGYRAFLLRTRRGHLKIPAAALSQGTLLALAILTLAYLPTPPSILCLEEPDRGIHPRLLRQIQDALYRLCYPENFGEKREPVQVIATTHSPYFLDLYRDHPEEIVIAEKTANGAKFMRLSERSDIEEILEDAPLGEVWFSGILGGVPAEQ